MARVEKGQAPFRPLLREGARLGLWEISAQIPIDPGVWYIAVGLGHPGGAGAANGWVVHPLKTYTSWVQNVATSNENYFINER